LASSFSLALDVALEGEFTFEGSAAELADRLAAEAVELLSIEPALESGGVKAQKAVYRKIPEAENLAMTLPHVLRQGDTTRAHQMALRGIELFPQSATFRLYVARTAKCSVEERITLLNQSLSAAERSLPAEGTLEDHKMAEWSKIMDRVWPTRSGTAQADPPKTNESKDSDPDEQDDKAAYAALKYLAMFLLINHRPKQATPHFERLFRLDPKDLFASCGLIACNLASADSKRIADAKSLLDADRPISLGFSTPYGEGDYVGDPLHVWARTLERFLRGDLEAARRALAWARLVGGQFEACLLGRRPYPEIEAEDIYAPGGGGLFGVGVPVSELRDSQIREALAFISPAWQAHPDAIEWLRSAPHEDVPLRAKPKPPKLGASRTFFQAQIEGRSFRVALGYGDGPVLVAKPSKMPLQHGGRARIATSSIRLTPSEAEGGPQRWSIVPDGHRPAIDISGLTDIGRMLLSQKFGIPLGQSDDGLSFLGSEACESLCKDAGTHSNRYFLYSSSIRTIAGLTEKLLEYKPPSAT
jgi:hypothetical protein